MRRLMRAGEGQQADRVIEDAVPFGPTRHVTQLFLLSVMHNDLFKSLHILKL